MKPTTCPYGHNLCTPADPCAYCERNMLKELVRKAVEMKIHRDEDGDFFCHECQSWNHTADVDGRCTTAMLQNYLEGK